MRASPLYAILPLLCSLTSFVYAQQFFTGSARLTVLRSIDLPSADPATQRVGCLDADGFLTQSNCATFTAETGIFHNVHSSIGRCELSWNDRPPFFNCKAGRPESDNGYFFPIGGGSKYLFLGWSDIQFYFWASKAPGPGEKVVLQHTSSPPRADGMLLMWDNRTATA